MDKPMFDSAEDVADCMFRFQENERALKLIEAKLAKRLSIFEPVRYNLIMLDVCCMLVEDELVADWHDALSCHIEWVRRSDPTEIFAAKFQYLKNIPMLALI